MAISIFNGHTIDLNTDQITSESDSSGSNKMREVLSQKKENFQNIGISDWEQVYALLLNMPVRKDLIRTLSGASSEEMNALLSYCEDILPEYRKNILQREVRHFPTGARKPFSIETDKSGFEIMSTDDAHNKKTARRKLKEINLFDTHLFTLAGSVNHIRSLNSIRSQGDRGTCTAFAVTCANEFFHFKKQGTYQDFSEQHLFFETKILENDTVCGAWIRSAMQAISNKGQCRESDWSYKPTLPCVQSYGKPSNADNNALKFKNPFLILYRNDLLKIKQIITSGRIIPFSIPIFNSWYESTETIRSGRITMPLNGETESGGHSMVLVGYQDTDATENPGGGYFIIRNSWGTDWGYENYYGAGYGTMPYKYITDYAWELYTF